MLGKLFKYDFKWINKTMLIYFAIAFILVTLLKIVESFEMTLIVTIIDKILVSMFISSLFSIMITYLIRIWVRFKVNLYKDESYLTHTIPVKKGTIYTAKVLASLLSITIMVLAIIGLILLGFAGESTLDYIKDLYKSIEDLFGKTQAIMLLVIGVFLIILETFSMIQAGFIGIVVGHKFNNYKMLKSILVGLMMYGFISAFSLITLFVLSQFNSNLSELFTTNDPSKEVIQTSIYVGTSIYLIFNILYYFVGKKLFEKGVNVD